MSQMPTPGDVQVACANCGRPVAPTDTECATCGRALAPTAWQVAAPSAPAQPVAAAAPPQPRTLPGSPYVNIAALVGAGFIAIGSFLQWASVTVAGAVTITKNGLDGDGVITLPVGIAIAVCAFFELAGRRNLAWVTLVVSLLCGTISVYDALDVKNTAGAAGGLITATHVGSGLWLAVVGSAVAVGAAVVNLATRRRA
jgi:hypothetical protein